MALTIKEFVPLSDYTTLKTGGVARYLVEIDSREVVGEALQFAAQIEVPWLVIGGGSNLLVGDQGFPGVILQMAIKGRTYVENADGTVTLCVGAGEVFDEVVSDTVTRGYWGLENLSAIPGTVGATPVQNVGAYGVEVEDIITQVEAYHVPTHTHKIFTKEECAFGYRDSFFKTARGQEYIITAVYFLLQSCPQPKVTYADLARRFVLKDATLAEVRLAVIEIRAQKFPDWHVVGTAGSFFKNPIISRAEGEALRVKFPALPLYEVDANLVKVPLGYILDKVCNLKGFRDGQIGLYEAQALVLVNYGGATAAEIQKFAKLIATKVQDATGLVIEPEVRFVEMNLS